MNTARVALPRPSAGSERYFVWLYTPGPQRRRVQSLMGIADELAVSLRPQLEHQVAHVRLEWWQAEGARLQHGEPTHPLTRELLADAHASEAAAAAALVTQLVEATTFALAQGRLTGTAIPPEGALFRAIAQLLLPSMTQREHTIIAALGERLQALTHPDAAPAEPAGARTAAQAHAEVLRQQLQQLDRAHLPALAPLLVWCALALRRALRGVSTRASFTDNIFAWRCARAAVRHQLPPLKA